MADVEKSEKINKLAKALKDSDMAKDDDEAMKMAEEMYEKSDNAIKEMKAEDISAQEIIEDEYKANPKYKKKTELKQDISEMKEDIKEKKESELEEDVEKEEK